MYILKKNSDTRQMAEKTDKDKYIKKGFDLVNKKGDIIEYAYGLKSKDAIIKELKKDNIKLYNSSKKLISSNEEWLKINKEVSKNNEELLTNNIELMTDNEELEKKVKDLEEINENLLKDLLAETNKSNELLEDYQKLLNKNAKVAKK